MQCVAIAAATHRLGNRENYARSRCAYLFSTTFQHFLVVLAIRPSQVGAQALGRLIGQLDAVLQQTDGQSPLQQRRWLG